jgi:UDP-N-acetylmuramate dehydrogenase
MRCPGSFFKNIPVTDLDEKTLNRIPVEFIQSDKIVAAKLLEAVGAKGVRRGGARFAGYHANLLINDGNATSRDILALAGGFAEKVFERFGITLEPEVMILDSRNLHRLKGGQTR